MLIHREPERFQLACHVNAIGIVVRRISRRFDASYALYWSADLGTLSGDFLRFGLPYNALKSSCSFLAASAKNSAKQSAWVLCQTIKDGGICFEASRVEESFYLRRRYAILLGIADDVANDKERELEPPAVIGEFAVVIVPVSEVIPVKLSS
jgi:hypothetical protein